MRVKFYRSIDASPSLLGMKGAYLVWFASALGALLLVSAVVGGAFSGIAAMMVFLSGGMALYFAVIMVQGRYSDRDLRKLLASLRMHSWIFVKPLPFFSLWN